MPSEGCTKLIEPFEIEMALREKFNIPPGATFTLREKNYDYDLNNYKVKARWTNGAGEPGNSTSESFYGQRVEIVKGFYKGLKGTVLDPSVSPEGVEGHEVILDQVGMRPFRLNELEFLGST